MKPLDIQINFEKIDRQPFDSTERKYSVVINGHKIPTDNKLGGCRGKYRFRNLIIKTDLEEEYAHAKNELKLYKTMRKRDRKYFPTLIDGSAKKGYIIQEFLNLTRNKKILVKHAKKVNKLIKRYNLKDIGCDPETDYYWNWAVCKDTGNPIIYDFGLQLPSSVI